MRIKLNIKNLIIAVLLSIGVVSILSATSVQKTNRLADNGMEAVLLSIGICFLIYVASSHLSKRDYILGAIAGFVIGFCQSIGEIFYATESLIDLSDYFIYLDGICYGIIWTCFICVGFKLFDARKNGKLTVAPYKKWNLVLDFVEKHSFFWIFLVIVILWIPAFLAMFPGYYSSDGPLQLAAYLNDGYLNLQWPATHTLFLVGCFKIGNFIFGSYNAGVVIYCIIQSVFLASAMTYSAVKLMQWKVNRTIILVITFFMAANPVIQAYAFSTTKDAMFGGFLLFVFVGLGELVFRSDEFFASRRKKIFLSFMILGMCLMRKQGIYVMILVLAVLLIMIKMKRRQQLGIILIPLVCAYVFNPMISMFMTVQQDNPRELLSIPSQQMARVYYYEKESLSEEELAQLSNYYNLEGFDDYIEPLSDPAKGALISDNVTSDLTGYIKLWMKIGIEHPNLYIQAFLWGTIGYTYSSADTFNRWSGLSPWNEFSAEPINLQLDDGGTDNQVTQNSLFPAYYEYLQNGTWDMFPNTPIATFWVHTSLPFFVLLGSIVVIIRKRDYEKIAVWMLPGLYWCTLLLGPVMCIRYVCPEFYCIPMILLLPFVKKTETVKRKG